MSDTFIDYDLLRAFDLAGFQKRAPFPWHNLRGFLTAEGFRALYDEFPPLELFEYHENMGRPHDQRPHNRHYLAYENSIYHKEAESGVVRHNQLPAAWQRFMDELETSDEYHRLYRPRARHARLQHALRLARRLARVRGLAARGRPQKSSAHISSTSTRATTGTLNVGRRDARARRQADAAMNPDFGDFETRDEAARIVDNHSFLFKNTPACLARRHRAHLSARQLPSPLQCHL